jgi:hypothetical protein
VVEPLAEANWLPDGGVQVATTVQVPFWPEGGTQVTEQVPLLLGTQEVGVAESACPFGPVPLNTTVPPVAPLASWAVSVVWWFTVTGFGLALTVIVATVLLTVIWIVVATGAG